MKSITRGLFALSILCATHAAFAETLNDDAAKVSITIPEGWTHKDVGNGAISILNPKSEVSITVLLTEAPDFKKVVTNVTTMLAKMVSKLKLDKGKKVSVNGMPGMVFKGSGVYGPKPVKVAIILASTPANKGLMLVGLAEAAKFKSHEKEVNGLLMSLKPIVDDKPGDTPPGPHGEKPGQ